MKALRTVVIALALVVPAAPAHAALIGLLGGNFDPPPITDPGTSEFVSCRTQSLIFGENDFCVFYNAFQFDPSRPDFVPFEFIESLDFLLGQLIGDVVEFRQAGETLQVHPLSDMPTLENSTEFNPKGLRLSGAEIRKPSCDYDYDYECEFPEFNVALVLQLGLGDGEIGDYSTRNLAVNGTPVPEPGTLLLLGPAAAALLMRRARNSRRRNQRTE